jgi:iron complex outermembrane receptor protein
VARLRPAQRRLPDRDGRIFVPQSDQPRRPRPARHAQQGDGRLWRPAGRDQDDLRQRRPAAERGWSLYGLAGYQNRKGESSAFPRLADNANNYLQRLSQRLRPEDHHQDRRLQPGLRRQGRDRRLQRRRQRQLRQQQGRVRHDQFAERLAGRGLADPLQGRLDAVRPDGRRHRRQPSAGAVQLRQAQHPGLRVEYRDETYKIKAGETASWVNGGNGKGAGAQGFPGFRPTNAVDVSRHATSLYVDLDNQITDKLDIDLAVRYEDYSDFGSTTTGKIAARYDFTDAFAIRGAFSTGFRAPALQQQYFTTTSINIVGGAAVDVGTFPATSATAQALGAKPLEPEKSKNYSLGAVYPQGPVRADRRRLSDRHRQPHRAVGEHRRRAGGTPTQPG